ncbi:MAG TPA: hypothetical protein VM346_02165 [Sphingomicrobium sp.]|nr:hypothetical protein [Sphingomicrobium sp.]
MSDTLDWLLYLLSAAGAFALVYRARWRITFSMIAAAGATTALWAGVVLLAPAEDRPNWINIHISLHASFALIFAGAGAGLAQYLRMRQDSEP